MKFFHLSDYIAETKRQLAQHELNGWEAKWMSLSSVRKCAQCACGEKTIYLNKDYYHLTKDHSVLINTIIHELAHALEFVKYGTTDHGPRWKNIFLGLGGDGKRLNKDAIMPSIKTRGVGNDRPVFEMD